jgi:hypothetical protein
LNIEDRVEIYPNPAENEVFINTMDGTIINEVNVYSHLGQMVLHETRLTERIDVSMLLPGIYVVEVVSDEWGMRERLIVR